jgi:hypothetical protein
MFIGVYLALCGTQYLIVLFVSLILIARNAAPGSLRKHLLHYSLLAIGASLLGLIAFSFLTIPVGNLHFNFPEDFTDPSRLVASLPKIFTTLLGLVGVTAPFWTLWFALPRGRKN